MEPVARRPRNAKLSAYYGLKNQPSDDSALTDISPNPNGDGSWAPNDLIKRLPLEKLVRASTKIRGESEKIERSLHGSVRRCYEQVDAAAKECGELRTVCSTLGGTDGALTRVARSCDGCVKISDEMGPLRERIEGLEESRRVMLLLRASEVLAEQLPAQFTELTGLCTDPVNARDRLFLTAHRCAIIVPQLATLSSDKSSFKEAHVTLTNAIKETVAELIAQVEEENGIIEGLSISDVLRIRIFLGIGDEELRTFFLKASEDILRSTIPSSSASCISGNSGLARGSFQIRHAANVMLEDIKAISCAYDDAFRGNQCFVALSKKRSGESYFDECVLSSQDFALWLSGTVDELIGSVVRKEVATPGRVTSPKMARVSIEDKKEGEEEEQISMADLSDFQEAVGELRKLSQTEAPVSDTSIAQVPIIIGALADSICSHVKRTITGQASAQMVGMLDDALFSEFPDYDNPSLESRTMRELRKVVARIEELGESCDSLLKELTSNVETANDNANDNGAPTNEISFQMEILGLVVRKAMTGPEFNRKEMWFQAMLRGAFICEQVAQTVRSEALKKSLIIETERLREEFTCKIVETASDNFRGILYPEEKEEQLDVMISGGSTMADRIVNLLTQGRKEVDLYPAIGSSLHEVWRDVRNGTNNNPMSMNSMDLLDTQGIDCDGVLLRIAENWVQSVRMATLTKDRFSAVESLVATMHERLSSRDTFNAVSRAANERCSEL